MVGNFFLILMGVLLNTIAQLCLKQGMMIIGPVSLNISSIIDMVPRAALNPYILIGMMCYVISFGVWLIVLSKVEVSLAYPMLSIGYVVTAVFGYYYMGEMVTIYKVIGIATICLGTGLLFKS